MEKMIIVNMMLSGDTTVTTVDGSDKNRIKEYKLDVYSCNELADRIIKRVEQDGFNRILVSTAGNGIGLNDSLIVKFNDLGYTYYPESGKVIKNSVEIKNDGSIFISGGIFTNILNKNEEF